MNLVGVECTSVLLHLNGKAEQQRHDGGFHNDVCQHQGLDDRIDRRGSRRKIGVNWGRCAGAIPDSNQQNVGRRLQYSKTDDQMHVIPAGDNAVNSNDEEPGGGCIAPMRQYHLLLPLSRSSSVSSRNASSSRTKPAVTAAPGGGCIAPMRQYHLLLPLSRSSSVSSRNAS